MNGQSLTGVKRLFFAAMNSIKGLRSTWENEQAFRQEAMIFMIAAPIGLWIGANGVEKALLVGSVMLIPIVELINSAVEATVDRIGFEHHELSGRAKDAVSAAVLLTILLAALVWMLILL